MYGTEVVSYGYEIKPFVPLSNFGGFWGILGEFGFPRWVES